MKKDYFKSKAFLIVIIFIVVLFAALFVYFKTGQSYKIYLTQTTSPTKFSQQHKSYSSNDLKISFQYPQDWFVDERFKSILIASYNVRFGELKRQPEEGQIIIFINEHYLCYPTIDEDLEDNSCGEREPEFKRTIISKVSRETKGGTFLAYIVKNSDKDGGGNITYYLLQKGERIVFIEPQPDILEYEREFEEIVNSIEFID